MKRAWIAAGIVALFTGCSQMDDRPGDDRSALIAFQSSRDGNFEVYVMNVDGSGQRRITNSPANDFSPSLSPEDTSIVFASDRSGNWEIYVVPAEGGEPRALTSRQGTNSAPSWAMGGSKILFVSTRDAINGELYLMNPDGSGAERLTSDSLVKDTPAMAKDNRTAFMSVTAHGQRAVASVQVPGGEVRLLTTLDHSSTDPVPSPDGSVVAFASNHEGRFQIYTMGLDGQGVKRLTAGAGDAVQPWWLPEGGTILFARQGQIFRLSLADGKEVLLSFKGDSAPRCAVK